MSTRHGVGDGKSQSPPGITPVQWDIGLGRYFRELVPWSLAEVGALPAGVAVALCQPKEGLSIS